MKSGKMSLLLVTGLVVFPITAEKPKNLGECYFLFLERFEATKGSKWVVDLEKELDAWGAPTCTITEAGTVLASDLKEAKRFFSSLHAYAPKNTVNLREIISNKEETRHVVDYTVTAANGVMFYLKVTLKSEDGMHIYAVDVVAERFSK